MHLHFVVVCLGLSPLVNDCEHSEQSRIDFVRITAKYETESLAYLYSEKTSPTWDDVATAAADESSADNALVVVEIYLDVCLVCQISPTFYCSSHRTTKVVTGIHYITSSFARLMCCTIPGISGVVTTTNQPFHHSSIHKLCRCILKHAPTALPPLNLPNLHVRKRSTTNVSP